MKFTLDKTEKKIGPGRICGCMCKTPCIVNSAKMKKGLPLEPVKRVCQKCATCIEIEIVNGHELSNKADVQVALNMNPNYHPKTHRRLNHGK